MCTLVRRCSEKSDSAIFKFILKVKKVQEVPLLEPHADSSTGYRALFQAWGLMDEINVIPL